MTAPLRLVRTHEYVGGCRYTGYIDKSIRLKLVCGHEQVRKASQGVPHKARCRDCEREPKAVDHLQDPVRKLGKKAPRK